MLQNALLLSILLLLLALTNAQSFVPTVPATTATGTVTGTATRTATSATSTSTTTAGNETNTTVSCPARYHDCAVIGRPDACCTLDQVCVFDESQRLACCPFRTMCVGTLTSSEGGRDGGVLGAVVAGLVGLGAVVGYGW